MSLVSIFQDLYAHAAAQSAVGGTGKAFRKLKQGAAVKVRTDGRRMQVILSRRGAPVGDVEIVTFCRDGQIPPDAVRQDYQGSGGMHYSVFTWESPPRLFDEEVLPQG